VSPVPRLRRYYEGATTSRSRIPGPLWFRSQAPRMPPVFVVAAALLMSSEEFYQAWNTCSAGVPTRHVAYADACGISQVPWRSVLCLCPAPRPRPSRQDLALAILSMLPSGHPGRRPQRVHNIEANTGPQHPLSALHERRRRLPCKTRFRLAGCASTGRGLNPLDRFERFQVTSHSPFQDFACRKGGLRQTAHELHALLPWNWHPPATLAAA
jgi:hypothetical protein